VALPLSALPFLAYTTLTPEGRLVRDRVIVAMAPPRLPKLSARQKADDKAVAPRYGGAVMALAYHGIGSTAEGEGGFVVSPRMFGEHLAALRAGGMNVVTATDVAGAFRGGPPLPENAVMITFDDGRVDAMLFADPLLKQARMKATMFVITDAASSSGVYYAPWKRLKGYDRSGRWDIQSHTSGSHHEQRVAGGERLPALTSLGRGETLEEYRVRVRKDLAKASDDIEVNLGHRPLALAYPFGAYGAERANDPAIRGILREEVGRQYTLAFHQDDQGQMPLAAEGDDRLGLRRLKVEGWSGTLLLQHIADAARRSGFGSSAPPLQDLAEDESTELALPQLSSAAPETLMPAAIQPLVAEPAGAAKPGILAAVGDRRPEPWGTAGIGRTGGVGGSPTVETAAPTSTLGPATGPTPTTSGRPLTNTPIITSPPTTRPSSTTTQLPRSTTTTTTTQTTTTSSTTAPPSCPTTGKSRPGCPSRGGTP